MSKFTTVALSLEVHSLLHTARVTLSTELGEVASLGQTIHSLLLGKEKWIAWHKQEVERARQAALRAKIAVILATTG